MREIKDNIPQVKATCLEVGTPVAGGLIAGFGTGSVWWGIAGAVGGLIVGWSITGTNAFGRVWGSGPRWDELSRALVGFEKHHGLDEDRIYFFLGDRKFHIYWKHKGDESYVMTLDLPMAYWRDMIRESDLKSELDNISEKVCESDQHVTAEAPEVPDQMLALIECVLDAAAGDLENLEVDTNLPLCDLFEVRQR